MTRYICDCEKLELPRAYFCAACNAYKQLEAELETERRLSFRNQVAQLEAERDAAVARYEYVRRLNLQQFKTFWDRNLAGERFDDMVDAAIDAARGEI